MRLRKPKPLHHPVHDLKAGFVRARDEAYRLYSDRIKEPGQLYHFTTLSAAQEILESGVLWASDLRAMKDTAEILYAGEVLRRVAGEFPRSFFDASHELPHLIRELGLRVACLSLERNLRQQWNDYSDNCLGCALAFDYNETKAALSAFSGAEILGVPLVYDPAVQEEMFRIIFRKAVELGSASTGHRRFQRSFHEEFWMTLGALLPVVKNRGHAFENEWRIQTAPSARLKTISRRGDLYTRHEVPICTPRTLAGLLLGPQCKITVADADQMLRELGYFGATAVQVSESELVDHRGLTSADGVVD